MPTPEHEVQPVVGIVDRHEVGRTLVVDEQTVDPQDQVDGPAADQVGPSAVPGPGHREAGDTEEKVHDVVEDRDLEDAERLGVSNS